MNEREPGVSPRDPLVSNRWASKEGSPHPLGVSYVQVEPSYNFALYSKHATAVTLLLYGPDDLATPRLSHRLRWSENKSGRVWHSRLPAATVEKARYYAYRVEGPDKPEEGHRFDPRKVLLDPYAKAVFFPPDFSRDLARRAGPNDSRAPLGVLPPNLLPDDWGTHLRPDHTHDAIIYELHVRGFTERANSGVLAARRGTFSGIVDKIPYLKELGVTIVELMPVFQFDPAEENYWGYMPLSFFAVHHLYSAASHPEAVSREFRQMVSALHEADIEVVLDVVYNHTTEGDETGPTYSFRGIDNSTYYLLSGDWRSYRNDAGTGNVLHTANRAVRRLVVDSLRYWVKEMGVDGFRFDLASLFTRNADGSINLEDPPIIEEISSDPDLATVRLIAEAWDLGSYQLGRSFPGISWLQWNGRFRDNVRAFVRGDPGTLSSLMQRLYGSDDLFPDSLLEACHPGQSVNYVTSHDGFTLYDLVSYDRKHNEANGHANEDGSDWNLSWNCGWEGDEGVPEDVSTLRSRQVKTFCCLLMLANGTPMLRAGDEFLNTQGGNNNPYNQDNETSWLDWDLLEKNEGVFRFFKLMIAFRKAHPTLARSRFWRQDVRWYGVDGPVDPSPDSRCLAFHLLGASEGDQDLYVMINGHDEGRCFSIQARGPWKRVVDTGRESPEDIVEPGQAPSWRAPEYSCGARSVVVLARDSGSHVVAPPRE